MPPKKQEIDPELMMKIKFKAKCQFRALYRMVLANTYWLFEGVDDYEGVEDVKRRVQQAVRGKAKKKQLLTIKDKAILCKSVHDRTDQEKKYLYRILGGLKCFKKYPNHVKKKLSALTYFKYYGPGRVIVRQHQEAHALYFIVTGEVVVSQLVWDGLLEQFISTDIGAMHAGDMFGEVSLLHNIHRTATVTTASHCELLALMKEDFKNVLLSSVQKQWDEVRHAMSAFSYFDSLDDIGFREGCIVAKMKSYARNETLIGDGVSSSNFVFFILKGRCQMIEAMQVIVTKRLGKSYYTLYDPYVPKEQSEQDIEKKYFAGYKNLNRSSTSQDGSQKERESSRPKLDSTSILKADTSLKQPRISVVSEKLQLILEKRVSISPSLAARSPGGSLTSELLLPPSESPSRPRESVRLSVLPEYESEKPKQPAKPSNLETFFMQVVQYNPGTTFGFGENMRDRRIVALTHVDCLLLPLVWLLQRNTANIWTRIQHFLNKKIPDKKTLFKQFLQERRWQEYRDQIVEDIVSASKMVNSTSVHDVPYSIRLEEMFDA